jgi:Tfp pilus assembly PilM family ATPase
MSAPWAREWFSKTDELVVVALGGHSSKAIWVRRRDDRLELLNYVIRAVPVAEQGLPGEELTAHLSQLQSELGATTRRLVLLIGMQEARLRVLDLPLAKAWEMRHLLRANTKHFFLEELADYEFDCQILPEARAEGQTGDSASRRKGPVLVAGAGTRLVDDMLAASTAAGWVLEQITFSQLGLANAVVAAAPREPRESVVAVADLGYRDSTISFLVNGNPVMTRVVGIGGDKFTRDLAAALTVPYHVAENVKAMMPDKVKAKLTGFIAPLASELRAAIDFFENEEEKKVTRVLIAGGTARSDLIVEQLQGQLDLACERLDLGPSVAVELSEEKAGAFGKDAPQLVALLGAAAAWFNPSLIRLNLLAGHIEREQARRRDPFRLAALASPVLGVLMLLWAGQLGLKLWTKEAELSKSETELKTLQLKSVEAAHDLKKIAETQQTLRTLELLSTNRFLWVEPLNALQFAMVDNIQVQSLRLRQELIAAPENPTAGSKADSTERPMLEKTVLTIKAKNSGEARSTDRFIEAIAAQAYFAKRLRTNNPVLLKERLPPQVDPSNPDKSFMMFTIEAHFAERTL